jgi:DNA (cytosine-5)-methyltransferase 1
MTLTVGSLFSGIGGLDLGLERAGMKVIWNSEIDEFACRVLKKHWPAVPNLGNIKEVDFKNVERPDVICGGYPCQPFSNAGNRQGEADPRHLFPWVLDAVRILRPDYVVLENVRGHLSMGGVSVIGSLTGIGYDSEWRVISAASMGAPHRRDRVFIVAYPERKMADTNNERPFHRGIEVDTNTAGLNAQYEPSGSGSTMADSDGVELGLDGTKRVTTKASRGRIYYRERQETYVGGEWWKVEPDLGRVAYGVPSRVDRLRGLGNAVVPQIAELIGEMVVSHAKRIQ